MIVLVIEFDSVHHGVVMACIMRQAWRCHV